MPIEPIVIRIDRGGENHLTIAVTPIQPVDRVWGEYEVVFDYPSPAGENGRARATRLLSNFPRAWGTTRLAHLLISWFNDNSTKVVNPSCPDPTFPGLDYPPLPTEEERDARPVTITRFSPVTIAPTKGANQ